MEKIKILIPIYFYIFFVSCNTQLQPLSLHPENPHYFIFRGKPVVLIGSTEHYGAVMNLDFDYVAYLNKLADDNLNITRTFTGIYRELKTSFKITNNTMAPDSGRFICPWQQSDYPGYIYGGNKYDLSKWDDTYFKRLRDFIAQAGKRGIVVELDLFSNYYSNVQWKLSPLYYANNINGIGKIEDHKEVLSLKHPEILAVQESMVKKIVDELHGYDNLYYEVCNEPYFGDIEALNAWEQHMTEVIAKAENGYKNKHLISQNIANNKKVVVNPNPNVSIFNFHYARPPETVKLNYGLNKPIGDNETGFKGTSDYPYRAEAWDFLIAGGALYNNLDYSFTTGHEDGTFIFPETQPGGGGIALRNQLKILKAFMDDLDFIHMKPANELIKDFLADSSTIRVLAKPGEIYALYINRIIGNKQILPGRFSGTATIQMEFPAGSYSLEWMDVETGNI
ncbi:MAG TPA: cellulase family glycosylhydrolase, partial [Anaerovoracaceae bacterium]|nr:cellulase family glycosylhydrolase [Anaerovoracaceae bacterium]